MKFQADKEFEKSRDWSDAFTHKYDKDPITDQEIIETTLYDNICDDLQKKLRDCKYELDNIMKLNDWLAMYGELIEKGFDMNQLQKYLAE